MITIRLCANETEQHWSEYVQTHTLSTFCHLYGWKKIIEDGFGYKSYYLVAENNNNVAGILPLFLVKSKIFGAYLVSMPFMDYGGILGDNQEALDKLLTEARRIGKIEEVDFLELRHNYPNNFALLQNLDKVNLRLALSSESELWSSFKPEIKNRINKSCKSDLKFEIVEQGKAVLFYSVFSEAMRDMGTPVMPIRFFENILSLSDFKTEVFLVKKNMKVIGSAIAIYFKDQMELPWVACLRKYFDSCPNNFLYWEAMKRGVAKGISWFNFGRSSKGSGNFIFKKRWGALTRQLFYQYVSYKDRPPDLNPKSLRYQLGVRLWKKLPLPIANYLGPYLASKIP
jgi:FemAB-related protein (PEP-CTERM system-associated)